MNTITSLSQTEIVQLKFEVRTLRALIKELLAVVKKNHGEKNITTKELMQQASRVFNVTSKPDPDDDLADISKLKPVRW